MKSISKRFFKGKARNGSFTTWSWNNKGFFFSEFKSLDLRDTRLSKRAMSIFEALQARLTTCVRRLFHESKEARQAYDFFSNPKVTSDQLLKPHIEKTVERIRSSNCDYILAIQDTTVLNYTSHKAKTQLGRISHSGKKDQYGLFQHNTLCVSSKNEALGLIDLQHFHNDDFNTSINSDNRPIEAKKTMCWINALNTTREALKDSGKKIITIADRDGDFFEFLHELKNDLFVIRAQYDRYTGEKYSAGEKLHELLDQETTLGEISIAINDVNTHEVKIASLKVKRLRSISIPPSPRTKRTNKNRDYQPVTVNVVQTYNDDYCWILLTTLSVEDLAACKHVTEIYKERWHVEDYHKVLKTGYQVDELYLHSSLSAIKNALTMAAVAACRLYWLIYVGRIEETISAEKFFKEHEWKSLYIYFKEVIPEKIPTLSEVIIKIARLGGYKPKNSGKPPGIKTLWLGFQSFTIAAEMYHSILSTKT